MLNNISDSSLYLKATNKGAYLAFYLMSYIYDFQVYRYSSPYIPVLQSFTIPFPYDAMEIWFYGFMFGPVRIVSSGTGVTDRPLCYEFYGTIFNPTAERADCPDGSNGSDSNCKPCYCNPCNCCCNKFCR